MHKFTQAHRLKKADEFSSVFLFSKTKTGIYIRVYYKPNSLLHSRLGLIVSKRVNKRANKRSYMKRLLRELFRVHQSQWCATDVVIRVIKWFDYENYREIREEFSVLTNRFLKPE